ncbi:hypothetical protein OESDEN_09339 [Oesophagostomum dentatum]|uniref:Sodium/calcium exchanger membrane region domain-containing protein n=1 Tax=Oesophagostomum dentatum TaxID=61180 RepID=A0A0B1SZU3_OESDE|nr:hypothetical protein OESDEN_09339 [Oesophagostomum dentatum]
MFVRLNNNNAIKTVSGSVDGHGNKVTPIDTPAPAQQEKAAQNGNASVNAQPKPPERIVTAASNADKLSTSMSEEQPLDLSWPDTPLKRAIFLLLAPITFPLACTLPDVRRPSWRSWFVVTFIGSVLWIALFSYLMVWWANTIGETFGIPTEVSIILI